MEKSNHNSQPFENQAKVKQHMCITSNTTVHLFEQRSFKSSKFTELGLSFRSFGFKGFKQNHEEFGDILFRKY